MGFYNNLGIINETLSSYLPILLAKLKSTQDSNQTSNALLHQQANFTQFQKKLNECKTNNLLQSSLQCPNTIQIQALPNHPPKTSLNLSTFTATLYQSNPPNTQSNSKL